VHTIADLGACSACRRDRCVKTLIVEGSDGDLRALVIRGDHELNAVKAQRLPASRIRCDGRAGTSGARPVPKFGSLGPVGLGCPWLRTTRRSRSPTSSAARIGAERTGPGQLGADLPAPSARTCATSSR